jgi:hypothetical protein
MTVTRRDPQSEHLRRRRLMGKASPRVQTSILRSRSGLVVHSRIDFMPSRFPTDTLVGQSIGASLKGYSN